VSELSDRPCATARKSRCTIDVSRLKQSSERNRESELKMMLWKQSQKIKNVWAGCARGAHIRGTGGEGVVGEWAMADDGGAALATRARGRYRDGEPAAPPRLQPPART